MTANRFAVELEFETGHTGILRFGPSDWLQACQAVGAWYDAGVCSWDDMCDTLDVVAAVLRAWNAGSQLMQVSV